MSDEHPVLGRSARPPERTEVTGPGESDVYDVWAPPADRAARGITVVLVHGGFWRARYDRHHLAPLADALAADGFHVANLEYLRSGMPGGGWPGTGTSVLSGLAAALADSALPGRVVVIGHSAGGHLALWVASQSSLDPRVVGAVGLAPAADLREVDRLGLSDGAVRELMGCAPEDDPVAWQHADASAHRLTARAAVVSGGRDDIVPASVVTAYLSSRQPGEPVRAVEVADADHFDLIDPDHAAYLTLLTEVEELTQAAWMSGST